MRLPTQLLAAVLLLAGLAGCGTTNPDTPDTPDIPASSAPPGSVEDAPQAAPPPTEGPYDRPVVYPDGLTVTLVGVEAVNPGFAADTPPGHALIKATVEFTNRTAEPIPLEPFSRWITIFGGEARTEAEQVTGFDEEDPRLRVDSEDGTRIPAGQTVRVFRSAAVPTGDVGVLVVEVEAPPVPGSTGLWGPYSFVGAELLCRTCPR